MCAVYEEERFTILSIIHTWVDEFYSWQLQTLTIIIPQVFGVLKGNLFLHITKKWNKLETQKKNSYMFIYVVCNALRKCSKTENSRKTKTSLSIYMNDSGNSRKYFATKNSILFRFIKSIVDFLFSFCIRSKLFFRLHHWSNKLCDKKCVFHVLYLRIWQKNWQQSLKGNSKSRLLSFHF